MKRALLLAAVACVAFATVPALADTASSDNKVVAAGKAVGRGVMWAPKQVCKGLAACGRAVGNGAKKVMGK